MFLDVSQRLNASRAISMGLLEERVTAIDWRINKGKESNIKK
jgi:hypothetical protein